VHCSAAQAINYFSLPLNFLFNIHTTSVHDFSDFCLCTLFPLLIYIHGFSLIFHGMSAREMSVKYMHTLAYSGSSGSGSGE
jgi:uncharacterized protein YybS (DUF2232 family)